LLPFAPSAPPRAFTLRMASVWERCEASRRSGLDDLDRLADFRQEETEHCRNRRALADGDTCHLNTEELLTRCQRVL
jgi:hypothetical protein